MYSNNKSELVMFQVFKLQISCIPINIYMFSNFVINVQSVILTAKFGSVISDLE